MKGLTKLSCALCGNPGHPTDQCRRLDRLPFEMSRIDTAPLPEFKSPTEQIDHDVAAHREHPLEPFRVREDLTQSHKHKFTASALVMVSVTSFILGMAVAGPLHLLGGLLRILKGAF